METSPHFAHCEAFNGGLGPERQLASEGPQGVQFEWRATAPTGTNFVFFSFPQSDHPPLQSVYQPGQRRERDSQVGSYFPYFLTMSE